MFYNYFLAAKAKLFLILTIKIIHIILLCKLYHCPFTLAEILVPILLDAAPARPADSRRSSGA